MCCEKHHISLEDKLEEVLDFLWKITVFRIISWKRSLFFREKKSFLEDQLEEELEFLCKVTVSRRISWRSSFIFLE